VNWFGAAAALVVCGSLLACSPLTAINALSPASGADSTVDVAYGPGARNKLDVYRPANATAASPVVVFFYGGNWTSGQRRDYAFVGRALAARGIVVVIPDYRLYPEVSYPDFLDDSAALASPLRALAPTLDAVEQFVHAPLTQVQAR
jgi:acetyl esterase/lipase